MKIHGITALLCWAVCGAALAQSSDKAAQPGGDLPDDLVIAEQGGQVLTLGEMRTKIKVAAPADQVADFFADGGKVAKLVEELLTVEQMAALARKNGLDKDPQLKSELEMYELDWLARRQLARHMASLDEPDYEPLARERYQANKAEFVIPTSRDVRHILVMTSDKSDEEARSKIDEALAALREGQNFDEVLHKYTEDPAIAHNGWVRNATSAGIDPAFAAAAAALKEPGDLSEPVKSVFGYHIIRFEREKQGYTRPYEEVREGLIKKIRGEYRSAARQAYVETFTNQEMKVNDEAMRTLSTMHLEKTGADTAE